MALRVGFRSVDAPERKHAGVFAKSTFAGAQSAADTAIEIFAIAGELTPFFAQRGKGDGRQPKQRRAVGWLRNVKRNGVRAKQVIDV